MSNHSGSYMLNSVLHSLDELGVFTFLGKDKTNILMDELCALSYDYDCNPGEILEEIGTKLGICYGCWKHKSELEYGVCEECA